MQFITLKTVNSSALIQGIVIRPLKINSDESGILVETLRSDWQDVYGPGREFAMQYFSTTKKGIAKDEDMWHSHNVQQDRIIVAQGEIVLAIADNRPKSKTYGLLNLFRMSASVDPYIIVIPKKVLHGYLAISKEDALLLNFPTELYNPANDSNISHSDVSVVFENGKPFSWDLIRKEIGLSVKNR